MSSPFLSAKRGDLRSAALWTFQAFVLLTRDGARARRGDDDVGDAPRGRALRSGGRGAPTGFGRRELCARRAPLGTGALPAQGDPDRRGDRRVGAIGGGAGPPRAGGLSRRSL